MGDLTLVARTLVALRGPWGQVNLCEFCDLILINEPKINYKTNDNCQKNPIEKALRRSSNVVAF
jgi:hypothetical protein